MLVEVENLKREKQLIWDEREKYRYEYEQVNLYQTQLQEQNNTLVQELGNSLFWNYCIIGMIINYNWLHKL